MIRWSVDLEEKTIADINILKQRLRLIKNAEGVTIGKVNMGMVITLAINNYIKTLDNDEQGAALKEFQAIKAGN